MTGLIIVISLFLILFFLAFGLKKRFGLLGLGIGAGVLLNQLIGGLLIQPISGLNLDLGGLPVKSLITIVITILPSLLLLFVGPKEQHKKKRLFSSLLYAITCLALIVPTITNSFPVDNAMARNILAFLENTQLTILSVVLILAIIDFLLPRSKDK